MPHAVGGTSDTTSSTVSGWDTLNAVFNGYIDYRQAEVERDMYVLDRDFERTRNTTPIVETDVDARLQGDPLGDTLRDTFTNPINLMLFGVAGILTYVLLKG